jgi:prepilin-type N-terminal cleavage/methylation domain-containing protein
MLGQVSRRGRRPGRGFSLIEALVVITLMAIVATFGFPALDKTLKRNKLRSAARETATLMRLARAESIKSGVRTGVTHDIAGNDFGTPKLVVAFLDSGTADANVYVPDPDGDGVIDADEDRELAHFSLPIGVEMAGPGDLEGGVADKASTFAAEVDSEGTVLFGTNGSASENGAFRFRDQKNILEARVHPAGTGRISIRKYNLPAADNNDDPDTDWFEADEESGWKWY